MSPVHLHGYYFEDLKVGMAAEYAKTVTALDVVAFAQLSGDTNPQHLDPDFAAITIFEEPIAHGILTASYVSAVLGTKLPGPGCIFVSMDFRFLAPVRINDKVVARAEIVELIPEKRRAIMDCRCLVNGDPVLEGKAVVMVNPAPTPK